MNPGTHTITAAERARIEHIDRLFSLGPRGTGELVAALADPSWTVRRAAVAALATLGDDAVEPLCALLATRRDNENALAAAVDALASSRGAGVVPRVLALARHERAAVIADAAQILGRRRAAEAVPALVALLDHANDNVAIAAIEALGAIGGTTSVDALARVAAERRFFRTFPAMQVLARTGDPRAIAALAALLEDQTYRFEAVRALGRTGAVQAIAPITALLANPSDAVVRLVAVALAELIEHAEWAGAGPRVSRALREVLAPSLPRLLGALRHADREERVALATVLGRAGDGSVLRELTGLLDDEAVARAATSALEHLADASDDALVAALATSDAGRRAAILPLLRSRAAAPAIRQRLHDDDPEVRARACEALARVGDTACVPALFEALADRSARVAHAAVGAIQALGTAETEHLALAGARAANPSVRR
ncbi:MAG: HEAT repeat domain-containing protein, partial [Acidobacteriota bacterium]